MNDVKKQLSAQEWRELATHYYLAQWNEELRNRIAETFTICPHKIYRCDLHSHSTHSDGGYCVNELNTWVEHAGLDLVAVTDHHTLSQTPECETFPKLWAGIEVSAFHHHVVVLSPQNNVADHYDSLKDMLKEIKNSGGLPFIAHPCGWYKHPYTYDAIQEIEHLGNTFIIEIGNGAGNMFNYFDVTDADAMTLWDRLLVDGKKVIGLGNTDAHMAYQLGILWNGILCDTLEYRGVLNAIEQGHLFVSDGPICLMEVEGRTIGDTITSNTEMLHVKVACYDIEGIANLRVIKNGEIIQDQHFNGDTSVEIAFTDIMIEDRGYYRAESYSVDKRRAYTNPIFIRKNQ
jgi:hypothetical protein